MHANDGEVADEGLEMGHSGGSRCEQLRREHFRWRGAVKYRPAHPHRARLRRCERRSRNTAHEILRLLEIAPPAQIAVGHASAREVKHQKIKHKSPRVKNRTTRWPGMAQAVGVAPSRVAHFRSGRHCPRQRCQSESKRQPFKAPCNRHVGTMHQNARQSRHSVPWPAINVGQPVQGVARYHLQI